MGALKVPINFEHGYPTAIGGNQGGADAIRNASLTNPFVLVSWEHVNIQYLTADLGVDKKTIPYWSGDDYDTVYAVTFQNGLLTDFAVHKQNYVPKSTTCDPAKYVPPPGEP